MKKAELKPTIDNLILTFEKDSVGRNKDLLYFIGLLDSIDESFSIALDSYWGTGKTFFVKQIKMILECLNENTYEQLSKDQKQRIKGQWDRLLSENKMELQSGVHIPIYYDAWENDNDNDPILSLVYQMLKTTNSFLPTGTDAKRIAELAGEIIEKAIKLDPIKIINKLKSDNPFEEISKTKSLKESIDEFISSLIPEHGERLVIIIDELDRCNPKFAVNLLERIKHYFDNDKVTFVFSVNLVELHNTIRCFYGNEFNAGRYLDRFFDLPIALPKPDMDKFYYSMDCFTSKFPHQRLLLEVINKNNMPLRECSKFLSILKSIGKDYEKCFGNDNHPQIINSYRLIINFIVPVVIGEMIHNAYLYHTFLVDNDCSLFSYYLEDETIEKNMYTLNALFTENELSNDLLHAIGDRKKAELINRLKEFCHELKHGSGTNKYKACMITDAHRELFKQSITLMSKSLSDDSREQ